MNNVVKKTAFLCFIAVFSCGIARSAPMGVKIKNVIGKVETQSGSAWKAARDGDSVAAGASVRTGAGSSCVLVWAGGNTIKLNALSNMKVASVEKGAGGKENSSLELNTGKLTAHAKKLPTKDSSFSVKTPNAVAGVRGTDVFMTVEESGASSVGVADGSVELQAGGETVILDEGFMAAIDAAGDIAEPEIIPPQIMNDVKEDVKEVNNEAKQAESESGGKTESAPAGQGGQKESSSSGGSDQKESATTDGGESKESATTENAGGAGDALSNIDNAMDSATNNDVSQAATAAGEAAMTTGDVEITIDVNTQK